MRKKITAALLAGLFLCIILAFPLHGAKGFGDFDSDSDYGGSDYGGSDYGGSDYGGSDYGGSDWSSSDSRSSRSRRNGSSTNSGAEFLMVLLFFGGLFALGHIRPGSHSRTGASGGNQLSKQRQEAAERREKEKREQKAQEEYGRYKAAHPEFSETKLFAYVTKLFTEMQEGWEAGDITNVRYGFVPDTWQRFDTQLSMKNARGETTHVRNIQFHGITVTDIRELPAENREKICLRIRAEYNVWVTSKNGTCIQGSPSTRHLMTYVWTMERTCGAEKPADMNHCPNCGAELDVSAFAECPFCHTGMMQVGSEWLIRDIQAESQKTVSR